MMIIIKNMNNKVFETFVGLPKCCISDSTILTCLCDPTDGIEHL